MKYKVTLVNIDEEKETLIVDGEYIDFSNGYVIVGNNAFSASCVHSVVDVTSFVSDILSIRFDVFGENIKSFARENGSEATAKEIDRMLGDFELCLSELIGS